MMVRQSGRCSEQAGGKDLGFLMIPPLLLCLPCSVSAEIITLGLASYGYLRWRFTPVREVWYAWEAYVLNSYR